MNPYIDYWYYRGKKSVKFFKKAVIKCFFWLCVMCFIYVLFTCCYIKFRIVVFKRRILSEFERASWVISAGLSSRSIAWCFYLGFLWMPLVVDSTTSFGKLFHYLITLMIINVFLMSALTYFFSYFQSVILVVLPLTLTSVLLPLLYIVNSWSVLQLSLFKNNQTLSASVRSGLVFIWNLNCFTERIRINQYLEKTWDNTEDLKVFVQG